MKLQAVICSLLFLVSPVLNAQELVSAKVDLINPLFQHQWVRQDANGTVRGRVLLIEASNRLSGRIDNRVVLSRNGKTYYETRTGTDGVFEFKQLPPGTYGLQAISDYTYAAFSIHILPASQTHLPSTLDVYASSVGSKMRQTLQSSTVPGEMQQVGQDTYYRDFQNDPIADQRRFTKGHQIGLKNKVLNGRISRPGWSISEQNLAGNVARILKDGVVVGEEQTTVDGKFSFDNVAPGIYDFVVSGASGFAAYKFEAVDNPISQTNHRKTDVKFVSVQLEETLNCELIQQSEIVTSPEITEVVDVPVVEEGFMMGGGGFGGGGGGFGGGSGGGFGGGGAGGAGGGGFAGLAGIAGLAIGVAALSDDDNPTPPSPFGP